jgi:hypothetical protein
MEIRRLRYTRLVDLWPHLNKFISQKAGTLDGKLGTLANLHTSIDFQCNRYLQRARSEVRIGSHLADQCAAKIDIGASEQAAGVGK